MNPNLKRNAVIFLVFLLLNFGVVLGIFAESMEEFDHTYIWMPLLWAFFALLMLYALTFVAACVLRGKLPKENGRGLMTVLLMLSLVNFFYLNEVQTRSFKTILLHVAILVAILIFLRKKRLPKPEQFGKLLVVAGLFFGLGLARFAHAYLFYTQGAESASAQRIELRERPNIYLLSFDALIGIDAARYFFGMDELPYAALLESQGFRVHSVTSARDRTRKTHATILNFGEIHDANRRLLEGVIPNPTYDNLRANGYKLQVIHLSDHNGVDRGTLDYFLPKPSPFGFCEHAPALFLYGYCAQSVKRLLDPSNNLPDLKAQIHHLHERIEFINTKTADKWFTFSYMNYPSHTLNDKTYYDVEYRKSYIEDYKNNRVHEVTRIMRSLIEQIKKHDPNPVIFVFGDHGAWLTNKMEKGKEYDKKIADLDRFNITLAVYPKDFCSESITDPYNTKYLTRDLLRCLAGIAR